MSHHSSGLNIAVIYGSARQDRQGIKAARFIVRTLQQRSHDVVLIDSQQYELPLLDRMYKEFAQGEAPEAMHKVAKSLTQPTDSSLSVPNTITACQPL